MLVQGAVNSAVSQGVNIVVGTQNGFSWKEVAVSAVTSAVSTKAMSAIKGSDWIQNLGGARAQRAFTTAAGSVVSAGMRVALGGKVDFQSVFADIVGNLIGDSIVGGINSSSSGSHSGLTDEERQQTRAAAQKSWDEQLADSTAAMQKMTEDALVPLDVNPDFLANLPMPAINIPDVVTAGQGDSITRLVGTSNPKAVEAFVRINQLTGSSLFAGRDYALPTASDIAASSGRQGQAILNADNAKLMARQQAQAAQAVSVQAAADRDMGYFFAAADQLDAASYSRVASLAGSNAGGATQSRSDPMYLPGPIAPARLNLGLASVPVNGTINLINSIGNSVFNGVGELLSPLDKYQGEIMSVESSVPAGGMAMAGTAGLALLSRSINAARVANSELGAARAARAGAPEVLFGQRRVSPAFGVDGRPDYLAGRSISDVASDLRAGVLHPDQLPIDAFRYGDTLVSGNTRSLAALSEAGFTPTRVNVVQPTSAWLRRLRESPIITNAPLPGPRVPMTPSRTNLEVIKVIELPPSR